MPGEALSRAGSERRAELRAAAAVPSRAAEASRLQGVQPIRLAAARQGGRRRTDRLEELVRRLLGAGLAGALLVVTSPLMLVIAGIIRLTSPGPVLFRHQRVGINRRRARSAAYRGSERREVPGHGKPFHLYKFRSMYADARERFPQLYAYRYTDEELNTLPIKALVGVKRAPGAEKDSGNPRAAGPQDPRVTRIGRWLRRTSFDELPNLWNVFAGDMHFVGPRPDIEENVAYYSPRELRKLDIKPGITGLAQVEGRGDLSFRQINAYDVQYAENQSLALDFRILIKTAWILINRNGAY